MTRNLLESIKLRILHTQDTPGKIAFGLAVGVFMSWSPLWGFHMLIALAIATLLKANKVAAVVGVWLHNPITMVPMFYAQYAVGRAITSIWLSSPTSIKDVEQFFARYCFGTEIFTNVFNSQFWRRLFDDIIAIGIELWIGFIVLGILSAIITYIAAYYFLLWHRKKVARSVTSPQTGI